MVEVFKTNVSERWQANLLLEQIHKTFDTYRANFDLDDCDKILRIKCASGEIHAARLINMLAEYGCQAEVLPDNVNSYRIAYYTDYISSQKKFYDHRTNS